MIKIPRKLITDIELSEKRIIVFAGILFSQFSYAQADDIINFCQFQIHKGKNSIAEQIKYLISYFRYSGLIDWSQGGAIYIEQPGQYAIIYYSEFEQIINYRSERLKDNQRINHSNVLLLLAYIRLYMDYSNQPTFHSNLLNRLAENTGLSVRAISSSLSILEELSIIHNEELARYKDSEGKWHSNLRIFVDMKQQGLFDYNWRRVVKQAANIIYINQIE